jgi:hypothetical protein
MGGREPLPRPWKVVLSGIPIFRGGMRGKMMDGQAQLTNAHNNIGHQKLISPGNTKQRLARPPMRGAGGRRM